MIYLIFKELKFFFSSLVGFSIIFIFLMINGLTLWWHESSFNLLDYGYANLDMLFIISPLLFHYDTNIFIYKLVFISQFLLFDVLPILINTIMFSYSIYIWLILTYYLPCSTLILLFNQKLICLFDVNLDSVQLTCSTITLCTNVFIVDSNHPLIPLTCSYATSARANIGPPICKLLIKIIST